ncbi:MAG: uroporphyrinogen-III decarboxylase-like protein [Chloroflexi bacterium]|nr:uroporphyrinogen-III decarboxylase-like protein [Chloroflexota bacterium]
MGDLGHLLRQPVQPDCEGLKATLRRQGTPRRVYVMELGQDPEVKDEVGRVFGLDSNLDPAEPYYQLRREIAIQCFLGYDAVRCAVAWPGFPRERLDADDSTQIAGQSRGVRKWMPEHTGPIQSWADFEGYPWPRPEEIRTDAFEWLARNLPDGMCIWSNCHNVFEQVTWLMGYESLCYALYDQPDLVDAMFQRIGSIYYDVCKVLVQIPRVDILFGGDDMGFKTQTMIGPSVLIEKSFPWHKKMAALAHAHGKIYLLHACGNLKDVMEPLIEDVRIDGKHSFEDVIQPVTEAKRLYGDRIAVIGGIDVDLLCRGSEEEIRRRVREVLDICLPGGGYCLGTGNTVANYIPLESYLIMLDEGRRYA